MANYQIEICSNLVDFQPQSLQQIIDSILDYYLHKPIDERLKVSIIGRAKNDIMRYYELVDRHDVMVAFKLDHIDNLDVVLDTNMDLGIVNLDIGSKYDVRKFICTTYDPKDKIVLSVSEPSSINSFTPDSNLRDELVGLSVNDTTTIGNSKYNRVK